MLGGEFWSNCYWPRSYLGGTFGSSRIIFIPDVVRVGIRSGEVRRDNVKHGIDFIEARRLGPMSIGWRFPLEASMNRVIR